MLMKRFFILCFFILPNILLAHTCNVVLTKNFNEKLFLGNELFTLTSQGLRENGQIIDAKAWEGGVNFPSYDSKNNILYFQSNRYIIKAWKDLNGIYQVDLKKHPLAPRLLPNTKSGNDPSVSPNGGLLSFTCLGNTINKHHSICLLNLKNNKIDILTNDLNYGAVIWINNYQFLYASKLDKLILFDIKTKQKKDLKMDGYFPSLLLPDEKHILLFNNNQIISYNLKKASYDLITKLTMPLADKTIIWLPKENAILYTRATKENLKNSNDMGDLFFYSLDYKKEINLLNTFWLTGGFVIPNDLDLKPVNNEYNKALPVQERCVKICNE